MNNNSNEKEEGVGRVPCCGNCFADQQQEMNSSRLTMTTSSSSTCQCVHHQQQQKQQNVEWKRSFRSATTAAAVVPPHSLSGERRPLLLSPIRWPMVAAATKRRLLRRPSSSSSSTTLLKAVDPNLITSFVLLALICLSSLFNNFAGLKLPPTGRRATHQKNDVLETDAFKSANDLLHNNNNKFKQSPPPPLPAADFAYLFDASQAEKVVTERMRNLQHSLANLNPDFSLSLPSSPRVINILLTGQQRSPSRPGTPSSSSPTSTAQLFTSQHHHQQQQADDPTLMDYDAIDAFWRLDIEQEKSAAAMHEQHQQHQQYYAHYDQHQQQQQQQMPSNLLQQHHGQYERDLQLLTEKSLLLSPPPTVVRHHHHHQLQHQQQQQQQQIVLENNNNDHDDGDWLNSVLLLEDDAAAEDVTASGWTDRWWKMVDDFATTTTTTTTTAEAVAVDEQQQQKKKQQPNNNSNNNFLQLASAPEEAHVNDNMGEFDCLSSPPPSFFSNFASSSPFWHKFEADDDADFLDYDDVKTEAKMEANNATEAILRDMTATIPLIQNLDFFSSSSSNSPRLAALTDEWDNNNDKQLQQQNVLENVPCSSNACGTDFGTSSSSSFSFSDHGQQFCTSSSSVRCPSTSSGFGSFIGDLDDLLSPPSPANSTCTLLANDGDDDQHQPKHEEDDDSDGKEMAEEKALFSSATVNAATAAQQHHAYRMEKLMPLPSSAAATTTASSSAKRRGRKLGSRNTNQQQQQQQFVEKKRKTNLEKLKIKKGGTTKKCAKLEYDRELKRRQAEEEELNAIRSITNVGGGSTFSSTQQQQQHLDMKMKGKRGRKSKDNSLVNEHDLPYSAEWLTAMPYTVYSELMNDFRLNAQQKALIKKIRRRGRNKLAAQKCRERRVVHQQHNHGEEWGESEEGEWSMAAAACENDDENEIVFMHEEEVEEEEEIGRVETVIDTIQQQQQQGKHEEEEEDKLATLCRTGTMLVGHNLGIHRWAYLLTVFYRFTKI